MTKKPKCPRCSAKPAILHDSLGILPCSFCRDKDRKIVGKLSPPSEFSTTAQNDRISMDRLKHAGDIEQPWNYDGKPNENFVKLYPEKARDFFTQAELEAL